MIPEARNRSSRLREKADDDQCNVYRSLRARVPVRDDDTWSYDDCRDLRSVSYLQAIDERLHDLRARTLLRAIPEASGGLVLDFSSNDYLGLSEHPAVLSALSEVSRAGSGSSRLLAGAHPELRRFEEELARFLGRESALLFSSRYLAAMGAIGALAPFVDAAYSDDLNHACLIDGLRLAGVKVCIYPHRRLPLRASRAQRGMIVSETIFGMDGDAIDPAAFLAELGKDDILVIDEAHAVGVVGRDGAGLAAGIVDARVVVVGTLSEAFGLQGGFVSGPAALIQYLATSARSFMFDTAPAPGIAQAARVALHLIRASDSARTRLADLRAFLVAALRARGHSVRAGVGAVVPVIIGDPAAALRISKRLRTQGIAAPAIRPPSVPDGSSRLRLSLRSTHDRRDLSKLIDTLDRVWF